MLKMAFGKQANSLKILAHVYANSKTHRHGLTLWHDLLHGTNKLTIRKLRTDAHRHRQTDTRSGAHSNRALEN